MSRTRGKIIMGVLFSLLTFLGIGGCASAVDRPECGGTTDKTDYKAPKTIDMSSAAPPVKNGI